MNDQAKDTPVCAFIHSDDIEKHITGHGHPERPERSRAVKAAAQHADLKGRLLHLKPEPATAELIALAHTENYIERARTEIESGSFMLSTGDTNVSSDSYEIALLAAGAVINAVDLVMKGQMKRAFCAMRPPGHHANATRGMGFCVFNNIAVGARYAQKKHELERVLIVDWDVHHGNGTQDIFYADPSVLFFSTHQSPFYPGTGARSETGEGPGKGFTMNRPFPSGTGPRVIDAFEKDLTEAADRFKPQLVMISAGFDSRKGDPLGGFILEDDDFVTLTKIMMGIAKKHAEGRLVSVLEGGYNLDGLKAATTAHLITLAEA